MRQAIFAHGGRWTHGPSLDRNERARLMVYAEGLDRRTHLPGQHGGCLKRTGLAVLKALLWGFQSRDTGRCDPSYDAIAQVANLSRSTVALALKRLRAAGILDWVQRHRWARAYGQKVLVRASNAYRIMTGPFPVPENPESDSRPKTTKEFSTNYEGSGFTVAGFEYLHAGMNRMRAAMGRL